MSTLSDRVRRVLQETGLSIADLGRAAGKSTSAVSQWLSGNTNALKADTAVTLEANTGYRAQWWATGVGPAKVDELSRIAKPVAALYGEEAVPDGIVLIREMDVRFAAGNGHSPTFDEIVDRPPATYREGWFAEEGMNPAHCLRVQVKGNSMEPFLYSKDTVLLNLHETDIQDGKVYALRYGDELRIKRIYRKLDGGLILHSDNPDHRPRDEELTPQIVQEHITIIGRVRDKSGKGGL